MSAFSMLSSIGGQWPFSYCHNIGQSAFGALKTLKSAFCPSFFYPSTSTGSGLLSTANQHQYVEKLGWVIQTRFHFGNQLSRYVGVSIFVKNNVCLGSLARATGLVLLVGVGSYFAYRLCLKLFGCRDLTSLLHCLCNGKTIDKNGAGDEQRTGRCRRCRRVLRGANSEERGDDLSQSCGNCGVGGQKSSGGGRAAEKRNRRRLFLETNEDDTRESSSSTSEGQSTEEQDEENPTEVTDLASDDSGENGDGGEAARVDGSGNREDKAQASTSFESQRRRWRNSAGKRTNALDDPNGGFGSNDDDDSDGSVTGFSKSRSPPPIPRFHSKSNGDQASAAAAAMSRSMPAPKFLLTPSSKAPSVRSMSVQSVPSSQQFIWDPVCTPGDETTALNDELLSYFADVPTGELVQRFLDGLFLSSDQNRVVSPGPSEAASEFSLAADRQLGDGTAAHFEQLQCDLSDLRTDVDDFDVELTTYLQERSECLQSDSRVFYRSVVVDDPDEAMTAGEEETPSPSPPTSPDKKTEKRSNNANAKTSPCRRFSGKRHRKSHESSNGSSSNAEGNNNKDDGARSTKKRRKCSASKDETRENDRRPSADDRRTPTSLSCNEKSILSLDTGYVSSYHTLNSADSGQCSPSSACSADDESRTKRRKNIFDRGTETRPSDLALPSFVFDLDSTLRRENLDVSKAESDESGKQLSSFFDSLPSSSGMTPEECWRKRPASAMSLEWDEMLEAASSGQSPSSSERSRGGKSRLKTLELMEFLRLYYNVDNLETMPKIYQIGRKLTRRGYRRVLSYNDGAQFCSATASSSTRTTHLDNLITASLIGAAHFRWAIFKCHSFRIVPEAVDASMKRCAFFAERCSTYFGSTTPEGTRAYILQCMQKLWQLHESVQQNELEASSRVPPSPSKRLIDECMDELIDGIKVLMALRSLETYEEILFTRRTPFAFYTDLFRVYTPASYAEQKLFHPVADSCFTPSSVANLDDLDIALLADTLGVRIEMFRPHSLHPESVAVYPEMEHNANLSRPRLPLLEPSGADGLFLPLII